MNTVLAPTSFEELAEAVRATPQLLAIGAGTKPRLSAVDVVKVSTANLRGISEYDPSEFTFTAAAGTPVREIAAALAERGQYLPFDPLLLEAGATLGGTIASGLSGPGRFRFGGLRDFILGVRFVDGAGRLLRMGGKVVKNAAGFDLPKFFVGSLGRFGVLAEITFKVFPRPAAARTLRLKAATLEGAVKIMTDAASARFEFEALDVEPAGSEVLARLAAPAAALDVLTGEVFARWSGEIVAEDVAESTWSDLRELRWAVLDRTNGTNMTDRPLVKVALAPAAVVPLGQGVQSLDGARVHFSAGGNLAFIVLGAPGQAGALDEHLRKLNLSGVTLRGDAPLWLGRQSRPAIVQAMKKALDPVNRFPTLDD